MFYLVPQVMSFREAQPALTQVSLQPHLLDGCEDSTEVEEVFVPGFEVDDDVIADA